MVIGAVVSVPVGGRSVHAAAAPVPATLSTNNKIEMIFGYVLDTTKPPNVATFTVKAGSSTVAVSAVRYLSTIVYFDLESVIYAGETVTLK